MTGYRVYLENIEQPGFEIVYNGVRQSTQTSLTLTAPQIQPSQYYRLKLQSKNCGLFSEGIFLTAASGSVPDRPPIAPYVWSYDSPSAMTIMWEKPGYDGGFRVTSYKLYVDGSFIVLNPSFNYHQLTGLTL